MLGIFALSGALKEKNKESFPAGLAFLKESGVEFQLAANAEFKHEIFADSDYHCAGTVEQRVDGFHQLADQGIKTFLSMKGGYGSIHCLDALDFSKLEGSSIFGYSDLTALFVALQGQESIRLYHSPMINELAESSAAEKKSFLFFMNSELKKQDFNLKAEFLNLTQGLEEKLKKADSLFLKQPSYLWGGNLSLLTTVNQLPQIKAGYKNILFIEDCYEEAYKIERLIYVAENQNFFKDIDELWVGQPQELVFNYELVKKLSEKYDFNLVTELPFGHKAKFTLPIFQYFD